VGAFIVSILRGEMVQPPNISDLPACFLMQPTPDAFRFLCWRGPRCICLADAGVAASRHTSGALFDRQVRGPTRPHSAKARKQLSLAAQVVAERRSMTQQEVAYGLSFALLGVGPDGACSF
jgi:hypothetical protein